MVVNIEMIGRIILSGNFGRTFTFVFDAPNLMPGGLGPMERVALGRGKGKGKGRGKGKSSRGLWKWGHGGGGKEGGRARVVGAFRKGARGREKGGGGGGLE